MILAQRHHSIKIKLSKKLELEFTGSLGHHLSFGIVRNNNIKLPVKVNYIYTTDYFITALKEKYIFTIILKKKKGGRLICWETEHL